MHYKEHPLAKEIIALQKDDGTWGSSFHSLSVPKGTKELTTEQALRRLWILGYTLEDEVIRKTVKCMEACLRGERKIDNYWEKTHDWELFTMLMLSAWIRIFEPDNVDAVKFSERWAKIIELAFSNGTYCHNAYLTAYRNAFSSNPKGARELDFSDFYQWKRKIICWITSLLNKTEFTIFIRSLQSVSYRKYLLLNKPVIIFPLWRFYLNMMVLEKSLVL